MNKMSMGESQPQNLFEITPDQASALFDYHPYVLPIIFPEKDFSTNKDHQKNAEITELIDKQLRKQIGVSLEDLISSLKTFLGNVKGEEAKFKLDLFRSIIVTISQQRLELNTADKNLSVFSYLNGSNPRGVLQQRWDVDFSYLKNSLYKSTYATYEDGDIPVIVAPGGHNPLLEILEATGYIFEHNNKKYIKKVFIEKALELIVLTITSESNELSENIKTLLLKKEDSLPQILTGQDEAVKVLKLEVWRQKHRDTVTQISRIREGLPETILEELIRSLLSIDGIAREDVERYLERDQILGRFKNQIITAFNEGQTKFSKTA